jgi:hypothetical protein
MIINLDTNEKELLETELEISVIPELRNEIASGGRKELRDSLKKNEEVFKGLLEKLKKAA